MTQSSIQHRPTTTRLLSTALAAALPALACACAGDVVNVGEDLEEQPEVTTCPAPPTGDIVVWNQAELDALEGCATIDGNLQIVPFAGADLQPLRALQSVAGRLAFEIPADIVDAATINALESLNEAGWLTLDGLESLQSVGALYLSGLVSASLAPLSNLRVVTDGDLFLHHCGGLRDLHGLENLRGVDNLMLLCDELESMAALQLTGEIDSIIVRGARLTQLGEVGVTGVLNNVEIMSTGLENLDAFAQLSYVLGSFVIMDNDALVNADGLNQLERSDWLVVRDNAALERLPAFEAMSRLNGLLIADNLVLSEVPAFPALHADLIGIGPGSSGEWGDGTELAFRPERIEVSGNPALRQFDVPVGWQSTSHVWVRNNAALERIGLGQLAAIDLLQIESNPVLASVDLDALATVDTLRVRDNPALADASFDAVQTFTRDMSGNAGAP